MYNTRDRVSRGWCEIYNKFVARSIWSSTRRHSDSGEIEASTNARRYFLRVGHGVSGHLLQRCRLDLGILATRQAKIGGPQQQAEGENDDPAGES